jgi:peptidoglycan/xylan/chitin deacetylase (PgdA/CDA1 family)
MRDVMADDGRQPTTQQIPVLMYHDVAVNPSRADDPFTVSASLFSEHLAALKEHNWETGLVRDIPSQAAGKTGKATYVTFDDAFESFGSVVVPSLEAFDAKATVFAPTAYLGRKAEWPFGGYSGELTVMSLQALGDLDPERVEVGAHGHRHLQSDLLTSSDLRDEFRSSRGILEQGLGRSVVSMAYPFGYHDRRARGIVREAGYTRACEVGLGLHALGRGRDLFIRRLLVSPDVTPEKLVDLMENGQRSGLRNVVYTAGRPAWREFRRMKGALQRAGASKRSAAEGQG